MATHSSVLAWRIPETGDPGGLPSMGSHRVGHDWSDLAVAAAFVVKLVWWYWILLTFAYLKSFLFLHQFCLNDILAGYCKLGCRCFSFNTLNISCHSLLACRVSAERSAVKCLGLPLYVTSCFSLAAFNILSLYLAFVSLINIHLGMFRLGFILYGTLCLLDLIDYFLFHVGEIFNYNFQKFSHTLSFSLLLLGHQ